MAAAVAAGLSLLEFLTRAAKAALMAQVVAEASTAAAARVDAAAVPLAVTAEMR